MLWWCMGGVGVDVCGVCVEMCVCAGVCMYVDAGLVVSVGVYVCVRVAG